MKLIEIDIQNMRTFQNQNWKVPTGVSLITGQNGVGKSTLMGIAAAWTIWGKAPGRSQDYLVRHGEREMKCRVLIEDNSEVYSIERRFLLNKNGKSGTTKLELKQQVASGFSDLTRAVNKETQADINKIVGPYEVWAMTAYVGQREGAGQFLEATGHERKEILRSLITSGDVWSNLEIAAKNERGGTQRELDRAEGSIEDLEQIVSEIPTRQGEVEAAHSQVENTARLLAEAEDELEADQKVLESVRATLADWDALKNKVNEAETASWQALDAEMKASDDLANAVNLSKELPQLELKLKNQQDQVTLREQEIADVEAKNEAIRDRNTERQRAFLKAGEEYDKAYAKWEKETAAYNEARRIKIVSLESHIRDIEEYQNLTKSIEENVCRECGSKLNDEHTKELSNRAEEIYDRYDADIDYEDKLDKLKELREYDPPTPPERPDMEPNESFHTLPSAFAVNQELWDKVIAARGASAEAERLRPIHADAVAAKDAADEAAKRVIRQFEDAGPMPRITEPELKVADQTVTVSKARTVNDEATKVLTVAETQLSNANQAKQTLVKRRQKISDLKVDLHEWEQVVAATGINGVRQLIIDQSVGAMETASNRWLQTIAPGFEIAFSTQSETDRETFEEGVIMPSGVIQPWSELSGAQSVAVALAVRLALAEVGGSAYGVRYETLYLDEADAWLTGDYQTQFMEYISRVAETGIDVVAITHIEAVQDMIDQKTVIRAIDAETSVIA